MSLPPSCPEVEPETIMLEAAARSRGVRLVPQELRTGGHLFVDHSQFVQLAWGNASSPTRAIDGGNDGHRRATKRADDPADRGDGYGVLIDHIWPLSVTREQARLDEWARDLAPSDELRRWFSHDCARLGVPYPLSR
jgi:hypothetical protein